MTAHVPFGSLNYLTLGLYLASTLALGLGLVQATTEVHVYLYSLIGIVACVAIGCLASLPGAAGRAAGGEARDNSAATAR